ncbi:hypothetical protein JL36_08445 [Lactococcus cremoris]|nr:hypothetical protein JL36_08445 [Lactococcus cremoris]
MEAPHQGFTLFLIFKVFSLRKIFHPKNEPQSHKNSRGPFFFFQKVKKFFASEKEFLGLATWGFQFLKAAFKINELHNWKISFFFVSWLITWGNGFPCSKISFGFLFFQ